MISTTPNNPDIIIDFIQPIQKPSEPQSIMVDGICNNSSYDEGPLNVWTDFNKEVVALKVDGLAPPMSGFQVARIYKNLMDRKVATVKKVMKFFPSMGMGKWANSLVSFPEIKGQITRYGLGYEPTEEQKSQSLLSSWKRGQLPGHMIRGYHIWKS